MKLPCGCIVLFSMLLSFSCQQQATQTLTVMTFNIRYGTANDGENSWEHRRTILFNCLDTFQPDIIGTQEALKFQIDEIRTQLQNYGTVGVGRYHGVELPDRLHESMDGESCRILYDSTRFAVQNSGTFWHSDTPQLPGSMSWGNTLPRIVTWARFGFRDSKRTFFVFNTHYHWDEPYRSNTSNLIMQKWREIAGNEPVILMGDFNMGPDTYSHQLFTGRSSPESPRGNFIDTWQAMKNLEENAGTFNGFKGTRDRERIDWILATPHFRVSNAEIVYYQENDRYPSDHYPVLAALIF